MVADCMEITVLQMMTELLLTAPQAKLTGANAHGQQPTGGSTRCGSTSGKKEEKEEKEEGGGGGGRLRGTTSDKAERQPGITRFK